MHVAHYFVILKNHSKSNHYQNHKYISFITNLFMLNIIKFIIIGLQIKIFIFIYWLAIFNVSKWQEGDKNLTTTTLAQCTPDIRISLEILFQLQSVLPPTPTLLQRVKEYDNNL